MNVYVEPWLSHHSRAVATLSDGSKVKIALRAGEAPADAFRRTLAFWERKQARAERATARCAEALAVALRRED